MEALNHIVANVPDWLKRLEELNTQVARRQAELAALDAQAAAAVAKNGVTTSPRSLRNKGSQESLRPHDEPEAHPRESTPLPELAPVVVPPPAPAEPTPNSPSDSHSPSAIARQESQARAAGQARARQTLRRRQRSDSVASAEGATPKFRSRSMVIVYYDSYVQLFFEDLVKFVSASRNMMRKAKMAAKVAQIKRLAELEVPESDEEEEEEESSDGPKVDADGNPIIAADKNGETELSLPSMRFASMRRIQTPGMLKASAALSRSMYSRAGMRGRGAMGPPGLDPLEKDVYDDLDKGLEFVQSMGEHAAHQFLRDGDCAEEVGKITARMVETKELADRELERVRREEPDTVKAAEEEARGRHFRPTGMRRGFTSSGIHRSETSIRENAEKPTAGPSTGTNGVAAGTKLVVDEGKVDVEAGQTFPKPPLGAAA